MDSNSSIERTEQPPYVVNVPGGTDYNITPLLSTGDAIPLLEGALGSETPSSSKSYVFSGIPDGTGITQINGFYYVFVVSVMNFSPLAQVERLAESREEEVMKATSHEHSRTRTAD
ncbi:MAG: hypothetical protein HC770_10830, partial [Pseudanabaena sp. CRU_2_10]|nr:hypothetical protein [Pseudanabaena sp. CRU_2_10]